MAPRRLPLLNFEFDMQSWGPLSPGNTLSSSPGNDDRTLVKRWYHYVPLCGTYNASNLSIEPLLTHSNQIHLVVVLLILAPHPSLLYMLVDFHLLTMGQTYAFGIHLFVTYTLTFLAFSSLIVCIARDPGPVTMPKPIGSSDADDDLDITEALMPPDDYSNPSRWCRKCWVRFLRVFLIRGLGS